MKKIRLYQAEAGDKIKWMGRIYIIVRIGNDILLRYDQEKWDAPFTFGKNCQMWVELIFKKEPETVGEFLNL